MTRPAIPAARYAERLARAQALLPAHDASAMLIGVGPDLSWLTGYNAQPLERLTMLVLPAEDRPTLIVPRLEVAAAQAAPGVTPANLDLLSWQETEDPFVLVADRLGASKSRPEIQLGPLGGTWGRLGGLLVSDRLWATFLLRLQASVPDAAFGVASAVLSDLRAVKDAEEIALLRQAAHAADRAVTAIARGRLIGRSEAEIAAEIRQRLVDEGHDLAGFGIVAAGANSASPHHEPSTRLVAAGEPIVFDIGGTLGGYSSDITRTIWVGGDEGLAPAPEFRTLYETVRRAQAQATAAVAPGVSCAAIDEAARDVIEKAGFGPHFIHRTGHGIGLEVHEDPYLVAGNDQPLVAGNAFSIEPGIYLEGRYGARIEDIVVCAEAGPDPLNQAPRELTVVTGT